MGGSVSIPTPRQVEAANLALSYKFGWGDGATGKPFRKTFEEHPREDLREAYAAGLEDGRMAKAHYVGAAYAKYGYTPSILRGLGLDNE